MVRKHARKPGSTYAAYSNKAMEDAMKAVSEGKLSIRSAAEKYSVNRCTLNRKLKGVHVQPYGRPPALSQDEEAVLLKSIITAAEWGFPLSCLDVRFIVKQYLDKKGVTVSRFKNNLPGEDWCRSYLGRHKDALTIRLSENIKRSRAQVNEETLREYFTNLKNSIQDIPVELLINYDETNLVDDPGKSKVIVRRGCKRAERIMDSSKATSSLMFAGTASGILLPPYLVYKAEHLYNTWQEGGPEGARYNTSKSGWFDSALFEDWFETVALAYFKKVATKDQPKALIGDNLSSHLTLSVIQKCEEYNIRFILLPPNSTHLCQPLDVAFFRPLKCHWRQVLMDWKMKHKGTIPKDVLPRLLKSTLKSLSPSIEKNLKSGFRATGVYPYNPEEVLKKLPATTIGNMSISDGLSKSLESYLRESRNATSTPKQKRRRLSVVPGKSVSGTSFQSEDDPDTPDLVSSEGEGNTPVSVTRATEEHTLQVSYTGDVQVGDFVVVRIKFAGPSNKMVDKYYVGQIYLELQGQYQCKLLRKSAKCDKTFIFPAVDDQWTFKMEDIIVVLPSPTIVRGRHKFKCNFSVVLQ
ncbi:uncharacterized protein LOC134540445 isoform X1 [Bacillus rossius redtenbacheri]|uniref:uncharacterized protein LOC134540445 isoform X1 n=1 Tax=Bacillus rossius redtenbacheri TaxID=93214 RepID=UPI002FDDFD99